MARIEPFSFPPNPWLDPARGLSVYAQAITVEQRSWVTLISTLPDKFPYSQLQEDLMERQIELGRGFLRRMSGVSDPRLHQSERYLGTVYNHACDKVTAHWVASKRNEHVAKKWRAACTTLQEAVANTRRDILIHTPVNPAWEVGPRLMAFGRAWEDSDILRMREEMFSVIELSHPRLLTDEVRRRLRVLEKYRQIIVQANIAYKTEPEWFTLLNRRLELVLSTANSSLISALDDPNDSAVVKLKEEMLPIQKGLTVMEEALRKTRAEVATQIAGRVFTQEDGKMLMHQFAKHLKASAPLWLGIILSGYFAYQAWDEKNTTELAFNFGLDLYQNLTSPPPLVSAGLMLVSMAGHEVLA